MASGDLLAVFTPLANQFRVSVPATMDVRNEHPVLDFDAAADEEAIFGGVMPPSYSGGGVTVTLVWLGSTAIVNDVVWDAQWERHQDDATDLDSDSFAAVQSVTATVASASGEPSYDDITFTDGAQMDSVAVNESYRLMIRRDANNAADDMAGDAELIRVVVRET